MSVSIAQPISLQDDPGFNPTSAEYMDPVPIQIDQPVTVSQTVVTTTIPTPVITTVGPVCQRYTPPWPSIIISVLGAIVIIYTAIAPNVDENRRLFGVILMTLWTILWAVLLWVLWNECHYSASWWLLLIPVIAMALFFILIIILNI